MNWGVKTKHEYAEKLKQTPAFLEFIARGKLEISNDEYKKLSEQCIKHLQNELEEDSPNSHNGYVARLSIWEVCFEHASKTAGIFVKEDNDVRC